MAWPSGIPSRTCTVGVGFGFESRADMGAIITVTTSEPELVWAATGSPGISDPFTITVDPGAEASFELIPTDLPQGSWLKNGAVVDMSAGKQSHFYNVTVQWTKVVAGSTKPERVGKPISYNRLVVPSGEDVLDLDKVAQYTGAAGQTLSIPAELLQQVTDSAANAAAAAESLATWSASTDASMTAVQNDDNSAFVAAQNARIARLVQWAKNPDSIITGGIVRNGNGVVTSAAVVWPDGTPGTFTTDTIGPLYTVDAYHVTYGSPATKTFTQPTITRDSSGAATNVPAMVVS